MRTFRPEEVTDIYRIRVLIELDAVREIKAKALPLDNIAEALEGFRTLHLANEDWTRIAEADVAFHSSVVATTGSPRLTASFASIATEIRLLIAVLKEQYSGGAPLFREHEELLNYCSQALRLRHSQRGLSISTPLNHSCPSISPHDAKRIGRVG